MSRYTGKMLEAQIAEWNKELEEMGSVKRLGTYCAYGYTTLIWRFHWETCHRTIGGSSPRESMEQGLLWMAYRRLEKAQGKEEFSE